jgi:hypothetical protein
MLSGERVAFVNTPVMANHKKETPRIRFEEK